MPAETAQRASPEALLALAKKEARGRLKIFLGAAPGVGKTYAMLTAARDREGRGPRCRRRSGRDARAARDRGAARRLRGPSAQADRLSQPDHEGVRPRRGARAAPEPAPRRRIRAHQRSRQPPSQALAGHRGAARRRHRRLDHAQHPASRKPQRRHPEDHARAGARDGARHACSTNADEIVLVDLPPDELLKRLAEGKVYVQDTAAPRRRALLQAAEPDGAARARAAARRRAHRRRPRRAHAGAGHRGTVGRRRAHSCLHRAGSRLAR